METSTGDVRRRPDLWSYISFSRPSSRNRHASDTLPLQSNFNGSPYDRPEWRDSRRTRTFSTSAVEGYPSRVPQGQRFRYLKYAGIVGIVLLLLFFISPGHYISGTHKGQTASPGAASPKCTHSYEPSKPLIQYALMIDAGSTGSRIHVYRFNNCGSVPKLEKEVLFKMTEKKKDGSGLSSYDSDAEGAARSLDPLLDAAVAAVPPDYRSCSPVAVKATAGLRKLGAEKSQRTLEAVRSRIENQYPFPLLSDARGGVEVMDGKDEGVYAWITINYLLGKIGGPEKTPTAAVFDLGGGSTQIVFEPTYPVPSTGGAPETLAEGDHKYELTFGGRTFTLYQHSYLGYGLMAARENLHNLIASNALANSQTKSTSILASEPLTNPCIAPGQSKLVNITLDTPGSPSTAPILVNMTGPASASTAQCRAIAEKTLHKEASCALTPCAFAGVHQPSLSRVFAREDLILLSYFYDRTEPLGMPESFTLDELKGLTEKVCRGQEAWGDFDGVKGAVEELTDRPEWCLDLNFMLALLHTGYELPFDREVKIEKQLGGNELGWCLGASLPLLQKESGWECKISEIF